jgi:hypothetical protein
MNSNEARLLLEGQLDKYRAWSYDQLAAIVDGPKQVLQVAGADGAIYQIEVRAYWDGKPDGDLRVTGCIDDGGWRAFVPLTSSFIKEPDVTGPSTQ